MAAIHVATYKYSLVKYKKGKRKKTYPGSRRILSLGHKRQNSVLLFGPLLCPHPHPCVVIAPCVSSNLSPCSHFGGHSAIFVVAVLVGIVTVKNC